MLSEIKMPHLGLTMTEGKITKWFFLEGDEIKAGDELLELTTDKLTNTIEAPIDGTLLKIYAPAETEALVGAILAVIGEIGDLVQEVPLVVDAQVQSSLSSPSSKIETKTSSPLIKVANIPVDNSKEETTGMAALPSGRVKASPLAKKIAQQKGYAIDQILGSGPGGRVVKKDVENFVPRANTIIQADQPDISPMVGKRKVIAERMSRSWNMSPHVTLNREIDVSELFKIKEKLNSAGQKSSYTEFIVKACARVLMEMPEVNRSLIEGQIHTHHTANIGVAMALPDGLIVPVVKDVQTKSVQEIKEEVRDLNQRCHNDKVTYDELTGGTFTVSNLGMYGIDTFTPVINPPESAILGVNRVVKKPVVVEIEGADAIEIRPMMNLSLSIDHRLVDGAIGAIFMQKLAIILENPYILF